MIFLLTKSHIGRLRLIGFLEGISYLLLLGIAMPLKYIWQMPEAVRVIGSIHGGLFVLFILWVAIVHVKHDWTIKQSFLACAASIVPFGTFWFDGKLQEIEKNSPQNP